MCYLHVKRFLDVSLSSVGLIFLSPLFLVVTLTILMTGSSPFFVQHRVGKNGKKFSCYKFKSMHDNADELLKEHLANDKDAQQEWQQHQKLRNDKRITRIGYIIRKTKIDELPQLLNVIKGDMSLIGPRPCLPEQIHHYEYAFEHYISVRPGITGLWQVSGGNELSFKDRTILDRIYVENISLKTDVTILLKTVPVLLKKSAFI